VSAFIPPYEISLADGSSVRVIDGSPPHLLVELDGERRTIVIVGGRQPWAGWRGVAIPLGKQSTSGSGARARKSTGTLSAPMPGKVIEVLVKIGESVARGDRLLLIEAMKMEMPLVAPVDGRVSAISVCDGDPVTPGQPLVQIDGEEESDA